jgi:hypothetical protein
MRIAAALLASLLGACASLPGRDGAAPEAVHLPQVGHFSRNTPGEQLPAGWQKWTLSRFKKPTEYRLVDYDGRTVVRARARGSASGLVHPLEVDPQRYPVLDWDWKITGLIPGADNTRKHTEDSPARVVVSFSGDVSTLPLADRMFFDNVRLMTGQQLPYATLMYIWENRAPVGTIIPNLHTSRIKMVVAGSGEDRIGSWQHVTRNLAEDFRRAFGEEPGRVTAVAIMSDTDNTGEQASAYYGDISFRRAP